MQSVSFKYAWLLSTRKLIRQKTKNPRRKRAKKRISWIRSSLKLLIYLVWMSIGGRGYMGYLVKSRKNGNFSKSLMVSLYLNFSLMMGVISALSFMNWWTLKRRNLKSFLLHSLYSFRYSAYSNYWITQRKKVAKLEYCDLFPIKHWFYDFSNVERAGQDCKKAVNKKKWKDGQE